MTTLLAVADSTVRVPVTASVSPSVDLTLDLESEYYCQYWVLASI